jgi:hypothetical protein
MRSLIRTAALALAVGAMLLAGSPAQAQVTWTVVPSPNEPGGDSFLGADAAGAGQVWAVGRSISVNRTTFSSRAYRHDGTAWRPATLVGFPGDDSLAAVDAVSATEAWAAGVSYQGFRSSTLVARWNGSRWSPEATPNGIPTSRNELFGIAAAGGSVWAVGTSTEPAPSYNRRGLILQRTNGAWRISPMPSLRPFEFLKAVDATGAADAWAVGWGSGSNASGVAGPIALRWNGSAWRSVPPPAQPVSTVLNAVEALSPTNVWAVGETLANGYEWQPYIVQFNGTSWRRVPAPVIDGGAQLTDIVALSATNIIAVGTNRGGWMSVVLHWNGSTWTRQAAPDGKLNAAAAAGPNAFWVVGARFDLPAYSDRTFSMVGTT